MEENEEIEKLENQIEYLRKIGIRDEKLEFQLENLKKKIEIISKLKDLEDSNNEPYFSAEWLKKKFFT